MPGLQCPGYSARGTMPGVECQRYSARGTVPGVQCPRYSAHGTVRRGRGGVLRGDAVPGWGVGGGGGVKCLGVLAKAPVRWYLYFTHHLP